MPSPPTSRKKIFFSDKAWNDCMESFLASRGTELSRRSYRCAMKALFKDRNRNPSSYSRQEIEAFISRPVRGKSAQASTFNSRLTYIQSFYNYAGSYPHGAGVLMKKMPPTTGIKRRHVAEVQRTFEQDEIVRFFSCIERNTIVGVRNYAIFLSLFLTARRESEIRQLKWGDITREGSVRFYRWTGKGMYGSYKKAELPSEAFEAIQEYLRLDNRIDIIQPEDYIFRPLGRLRNEPAKHRTVDYGMKKYLHAAGIKTGSMHWLRHTSAYFRSLDGADLRELMQLLNHKSPATTLGYLEAWKKPARDQRASRLAQLVMK